MKNRKSDTPYSEELGEWLKSEKNKRRDKNLVAFLAIKDDVEEALLKGFTAKAIWEHKVYLKEIDFGYEPFLKFTKQQIINKRIASNSNPSEGTPKSKDGDKPIQKKFKKKEEVTQPQNSGITGFVFNPVPNKEDLF